MAKTFDPALSSERDRVRLRIGDTDPTTAILEDATIDALLGTYAFNEAAAQSAEAIGAFFIKKAETAELVQLKVTYRERYQNYMDLAADIRGSQSPSAPVSTGSAAAMLSHPDLKDYRTT